MAITAAAGAGFNPRVLAGGRDDVTGATDTDRRVSIHASSREDATSSAIAAPYSAVVSIHASSREDATTVCIHKKPVSGFNPRVLAGGRDSAEARAGSHFPVSIHASSREDATGARTRKNRLAGFNPRVLAGGRDMV